MRRRDKLRSDLDEAKFLRKKALYTSTYSIVWSFVLLVVPVLFAGYLYYTQIGNTSLLTTFLYVICLISFLLGLSQSHQYNYYSEKKYVKPPIEKMERHQANQLVEESRPHRASSVISTMSPYSTTIGSKPVFQARPSPHPNSGVSQRSRAVELGLDLGSPTIKDERDLNKYLSSIEKKRKMVAASPMKTNTSSFRPATSPLSTLSPSQLYNNPQMYEINKSPYMNGTQREGYGGGASRDGYGGGNLSDQFTSSLQYQPALRNVENLRGSFEKHGYVQAEKALKELKISPKSMEDWVENIRTFISKKCNDMIQKLEANTSELVRDKMVDIDFLKRKRKTIFFAMINMNVKYVDFCQTVIQAEMNNPNFYNHYYSSRRLKGPDSREPIHLIKERKDLERFLVQAGGEEHVGYVLERLIELCSDGFLNKMIWDRGGSYQGNAWTEDKPADATIIMHAFLAYMDSILPPLNNIPCAFSHDHFLDSDNYKESTEISRKGKLLILHTKVKPPHFEIWHDEKKIEIVPGKFNVFHCIVLMLYLVKKIKKAHLFNLDLGPLIEDIVVESSKD